MLDVSTTMRQFFTRSMPFCSSVGRCSSHHMHLPNVAGSSGSFGTRPVLAFVLRCHKGQMRMTRTYATLTDDGISSENPMASLHGFSEHAMSDSETPYKESVEVEDEDSLIRNIDYISRQFSNTGRIRKKLFLNKILTQVESGLGMDYLKTSSFGMATVLKCAGLGLSTVKVHQRTHIMERLWAGFQKHGLPLNSDHFNIRLMAWLENERDFDGMGIVKEMRRLGMEPNQHTYGLLLSKFCLSADDNSAQKILSDAKADGITVDDRVVKASFLYCYAFNGDDEKTSQFLKILGHMNMSTGYYLKCNTVIDHLILNGKYEAAVILIATLSRHGMSAESEPHERCINNMVIATVDIDFLLRMVDRLQADSGVQNEVYLLFALFRVFRFRTYSFESMLSLITQVLDRVDPDRQRPHWLFPLMMAAANDDDMVKRMVTFIKFYFDNGYRMPAEKFYDQQVFVRCCLRTIGDETGYERLRTFLLTYMSESEVDSIFDEYVTRVNPNTLDGARIFSINHSLWEERTNSTKDQVKSSAVDMSSTADINVASTFKFSNFEEMVELEKAFDTTTTFNVFNTVQLYQLIKYFISERKYVKAKNLIEFCVAAHKEIAWSFYWRLSYIELALRSEGIHVACDAAVMLRNHFLVSSTALNIAYREPINDLLTTALKQDMDFSEAFSEAERLQGLLLDLGIVPARYYILFEPFVRETLRRHGYKAALKVWHKQLKQFCQPCGFVPLLMDALRTQEVRKQTAIQRKFEFRQK